MTEGDQDDTRGDAAEDVDRNGEEFRSGEEARAKPFAAPRSPSKIEWEVLHIPFRSWCRQCVAGRGLERRHLGRKGGELYEH